MPTLLTTPQSLSVSYIRYIELERSLDKMSSSTRNPTVLWPLTTRFTPPVSCGVLQVPWDTCTEVVVFPNTMLVCEPGTKEDCLPTPFDTHYLTPTFSPGVCPSGYYDAWTPFSTAGPATSFCCPSFVASCLCFRDNEGLTTCVLLVVCPLRVPSGWATIRPSATNR